MRIKILTEQFDSNENKLDEIFLVTEGTIRKENDLFIIDYKENVEDSDEDIITRLRVSKNKLVMTKLGMLSSTLEFEVGKKCNSIYSTIYGDFKMVISTLNYDYRIEENNTGYITLKYKISLGSNDPYINVLSINLYE